MLLDDDLIYFTVAVLAILFLKHYYRPPTPVSNYRKSTFAQSKSRTNSSNSTEGERTSAKEKKGKKRKQEKQAFKLRSSSSGVGVGGGGGLQMQQEPPEDYACYGDGYAGSTGCVIDVAEDVFDGSGGAAAAVEIKRRSGSSSSIADIISTGKANIRERLVMRSNASRLQLPSAS